MPTSLSLKNDVTYLWPTGNEQIDLDLIREICEQSSMALMQFYQRYRQTITGFVMSRLNSEADCNEILNDVLHTVWTSAGSFGSRSSVRTWVLGITHHKTVDYLRKQHREKRIQNELGLDQESYIPENCVDQAMSALSDITIVRKCLQQLSPAHREVLHLAFYEDLSCSQIAEVLECPLGTVKTRIMHAKNKMKQLLSMAENVEVEE